MFYNELEILELRLGILDKYVDQFVLVESEVNHSGGIKELSYKNNMERFSAWNHKIKHVIVKAERAPTDENPWCREKFQRECILEGLTDIPDDAIVMVSDVDEIPDLTKITYNSLPYPICVAHMWMFEYYVDYVYTGEPWFGTIVTTCNIFKHHGPNYLREKRWSFPRFTYAGWHLSSFGGPARVALKVNTYAHSKDAHEIPWTEETFDRLILNGLHTDGTTQLVRWSPMIPLPAPVDTLERLGLKLNMV
jgi:beta-1,4-mannosyl-glycoprotein beta-1,4-N-acetylglucosaminyltransferase